MPLLNPLRTSTYTSSTSASTTPTQSARDSLYVTTGTEQNGSLYMTSGNEQTEDLRTSYFSFKSSSSSSKSPSISPKNTLDSTLDSTQLLQPLYPLAEQASERPSAAVTPAISPALESKDPDPLTRYLSSSESASSGESASESGSPGPVRSPTPESLRPTPPPKENGPFAPPRQDAASSPLLNGKQPKSPLRSKEKRIPAPLNLHIASQMTPDARAVAVAVKPVPIVRTAQQVVSPRPIRSARGVRPNIATPVDLSHTGKPRIVSISRTSPATSCFYASQTSASPPSTNRMRHISTSTTSSTQTNTLYPLYPTRSSKETNFSTTSSSRPTSSTSLLAKQTFARKLPSTERATYPSMRPIASLDSNAQNLDSVPRSSTLPSMYPTRLAPISSLSAPPPSFYALSLKPTISSTPPPSSHRHSSSRPATALTIPSTFDSAPSTQPAPLDLDQFNDLLAPSRPKSKWSRFVAQRRAGLASGQRSRGAGIRPSTAGGFSSGTAQLPLPQGRLDEVGLGGLGPPRVVQEDELEKEFEEWRLKGKQEGWKEGKTTERLSASSVAGSGGLVRRLSFLGDRSLSKL